MDVTMDADRVDLGQRLWELATSVYSLVIALVLWEVAGQLGLVYYNFLPPLSDILVFFWQLTTPDQIQCAGGCGPGEVLAWLTSSPMIQATILTIKRAMVGLAIGVALGVPIGLLTGRNRLFNWFWNPVIAIGYPVPIISLIPVFMLWFGIGDQSKIILVALATFWPVTLNTRDATQEVTENLIWSARMMGTSDRRLLWRIVVPAAAPGILTGIQIALPIAFIATFIFEMIAGGGGLGHLQIQGARQFESRQVYAAIIAIMLVGLFFDRGLRRLRNWILSWE